MAVTKANMVSTVVIDQTKATIDRLSPRKPPHRDGVRFMIVDNVLDIGSLSLFALLLRARSLTVIQKKNFPPRNFSD